MSILVQSDFESDHYWFDFLKWESFCKERDFAEEIDLSDSVSDSDFLIDGGSDDGGSEKS